MPYIQQVALGKRPHLNIFGSDYNTIDGTGVRDYIHVVDLAEGHCKAITWMEANVGKCEVFNLGTGKGSSVLQMVKAMEKASGKKIKTIIGPRRSVIRIYKFTTKQHYLIVVFII